MSFTAISELLGKHFFSPQLLTHFIVAFAASFIGSVLAATIIGFLDRRFRAPARAFPAEPVEGFPKPFALLAASYSLIVSWVMLISLLVALALGLAGWRSDTVVVVLLGSFLGFVGLYIPLAVRARCRKCGKHVTIQWIKRPPFSEPLLGVDAWAAVVLRLVIHRRFRCMYCGQRYLV